MRSLFFIFIFFQFLLGIPKNIQKKIDKEILMIFDIKSYSKKAIIFDGEINKDLLVSFDEDNLFEISGNGKNIGFYYFGSALGKMDEFDFVVIFDGNLIIKKIKVLAYREDYGMEIGSKRWLSQFNELKYGDQVTYQKEIKAISGATISAKAMTKAINDLLKSISILQNKNLI